MKTKHSTCLLISGIIGLAYVIYLICYFGGSMMGAKEATEVAASTIATALVTPHIVLVALAVIFNLIGFFANKSWAAIVAGILYSVGGVMFLLYIVFVIPSIVLSFVGSSRVKKIIANKPETSVEA